MSKFYKSTICKWFIISLFILVSCKQSELVSGNYMLSSTAGNEQSSKDYIGKATIPTIKQKQKITVPGSSILFVEMTNINNRILWQAPPSVEKPDEGLNKSLIKSLNESLANLDASNTSGIPIKGGISLEKIANVEFKVDTIHKFIRIASNSEYDYSKICESSVGVYTGKIKKATKDKLNYIQRIYNISGRFDLKAKDAYKAEIQAQIENLPVELKSKWSRKDDDTFEFELIRSWAVVEVVALPRDVCQQVEGQRVSSTEVGLLKKKN